MAHMFSCVEHEGCLSSFVQAFTGPTLLKLRQRGIVAELWPNGAGFRNHRLNFVWTSISCEAGWVTKWCESMWISQSTECDGYWWFMRIHHDSCVCRFSHHCFLLATFRKLVSRPKQIDNATTPQGCKAAFVLTCGISWHSAHLCPALSHLAAASLHRPLGRLAALICSASDLSGPCQDLSGCNQDAEMLALYLVCWFRHSLHDAHSFMVFYDILWTYMNIYEHICKIL
jgi:hypothetical protein